MSTETLETFNEGQIAALRSGNWLAAIDPGREYYMKRTDGWNWFGTPRHWEIFVRFYDGFHGSGGAIVTEIWRWNGSSEDIRKDVKHLSYDESVALVEQLLSANNRHEPRAE